MNDPGQQEQQGLYEEWLRDEWAQQEYQMWLDTLDGSRNTSEPKQNNGER